MTVLDFLNSGDFPCIRIEEAETGLELFYGRSSGLPDYLLDLHVTYMYECKIFGLECLVVK